MLAQTAKAHPCGGQLGWRVHCSACSRGQRKVQAGQLNVLGAKIKQQVNMLVNQQRPANSITGQLEETGALLTQSAKTKVSEYGWVQEMPSG